MIDDRVRVPALSISTADFLFELFETGLDLPPGAIAFDDLLNGKRQVCREQCDPLCFAVDSDHANPALEIFEHDDTVKSHDLPGPSVEVDGVGLGLIAIFRSQVRRIAEEVPVLAGAALFLLRRGLREFVNVDVASQSGQQVDVLTQFFANGSPQPIVSEPGIGHDKHGSLVVLVDFHKHFGCLLKFVLKDNFFFTDPDLLLLNRLAGMIESERQRQTSPAPFDPGEQTHGDDVLSPWVR